MKRSVDIVLALIAILISLPLDVLLALAVKLDSPGPILHRSVRAGKDGRPFTLYKFRTMVVTAGPKITTANDPRVTTVGRLLRKAKLDELPQFFNVLKGDMSFVGPRPEDPSYVAGYTTEQKLVLSVKPGLVSPAVVKYRDEESLLASSTNADDTYRQEILPDKLAMDLRYIQERSLQLDVATIFGALRGIFKHRPPTRDEKERSS